ncbi:MAG TPA: bifunctional aldolase/short-chain dehydrogenase [Stellaceae bacterium]|jgi:rhamnose utilization protein RhaD (predicted bifunctional aldolase and dehydrogenase)/NAD(P)-dependent dehydrogenase (short-subunit alcohol dehydrogenase family)|nr:bifunctional aldolase/short-chain dehydrogenase [Stellaceae bacterium]
MRSLWSDTNAERMVERYAQQGVARDLALRVYTSRLLGGDPKLVLHGGGNTSVKTVVKDLLDEEVEVLCVKGSGWDMAAIEPAGLPAVRLAPLRKLRARLSLADEEMVRVQRANLIDPGAPNPSVETLLHAFLPHKFVDHTHSTAVLAIADQPDAAERCADLYGERMALVPYIMPGFQLAKKAAEIFEDDPAVDGLVLLKHGVFTFGATAREAYERMITAVSLAEERLARRRTTVFAAARLPAAVAGAAEVAPILRGACAIPDPTGSGAYKRFILEFRSDPAVLDYVNGAELHRYGQAGVATPDHTIRTKNYPLIVPAPEPGRLDAFNKTVRDAVDHFAAEYHAYFARHNARQEVPKRELDPMPRVILVPGLGLFGLGGNARDARVAADIAQSTIATVTDAEAVGQFESVSEADLFDIEYWSLEQAKLGQASAKPLAGQIAVVTGGAGTIGLATARAMSAAGAEVALLDLDADAIGAAAKKLGGLGLACDVTDPAAVRASFDRIAAHFGGADIVVSNAGAAWQGRIGEVEDTVLRRSFELNFFAHQSIAQNAVRIMLAQGTGGCLLFNVSKQAVNPGANFGPYGLPKAATLALVRQYALDYGADGIRANAVNADRIRSGLLTPELIAARAKARGVGERDYMAGNLLGREVTADDVAQAFLHQALALKTTADVTTVDGGNIAAALR